MAFDAVYKLSILAIFKEPFLSLDSVWDSGIIYRLNTYLHPFKGGTTVYRLQSETAEQEAQLFSNSKYFSHDIVGINTHTQWAILVVWCCRLALQLDSHMVLQSNRIGKAIESTAEPSYNRSLRVGWKPNPLLHLFWCSAAASTHRLSSSSSSVDPAMPHFSSAASKPAGQAVPSFSWHKCLLCSVEFVSFYEELAISLFPVVVLYLIEVHRKQQP